MTSTKKRTLNEIRQTKDSYYVVPDSQKKNMAEEVITSYLKHAESEGNISIENYREFLAFLNLNRYKITQE
tara:strand:- start:1374 stop:1586 length:213 start_codon:yes stop_codon:yes gene_type:complete